MISDNNTDRDEQPKRRTNLSTYSVLGGGVDQDGWWKSELLNLKTNRTVKVSRKRVAELRRAGRISEACLCPAECDCENPEPKSGAALISNECPVHNLIPQVSPDCPAHPRNGHKNGAIDR